MNGTEILQSVVALAAWTMVMWLWMYATRLPAMGKVPDLDTKNLVGGTGKDLDNILPAKVQWIAHNYNHLHEAPTVFYAVALVLSVSGHGGGLNATLGWAYVGLRVLHSLIQVTSNRIMVRFSVFVLSSLVLIALIVHAALAVF
jgi:hypothetical protein